MEQIKFRIKVWDDTRIKAQQFYEPPNSIRYKDPLIKNANIKLYSIYKTNLSVICKDTIDCTLELQDSGLNPVLLNMANAFVPGGGVYMGASAQEENIFRRTNYFKTLKHKPDFYPLLNNSGIYSKDVTVFKNSEEKKYTDLESKRSISLIALASIDCRTEQFDPILQEKKIDMIFNIALYHGHDSLVLSAFGCGAFKCDPVQVSHIFKKVIDKYNGCFKNITFAILHSDNNLNVFKNTII